MASREFQAELQVEGSVAQQFAKKLAVLVPIAQALGARLGAWAKTEDFQRLAQSFAEADNWAKAAPQKLSEALATEGLIPHPLVFRLGELRELTSLTSRVRAPRPST